MDSKTPRSKSYAILVDIILFSVCKFYVVEVCVDGDIQLFGSTTASNGGLAVCKDEKWWTIGGSSVNWRTKEAAVICRQLTLSDKSEIIIMRMHTQ